MLGMSALVLIHTFISLVAIAAGFALIRGMWSRRRVDRWSGWFLATTIFTSASGFVLPASRFMPSHAVGLLSLAILGLACYARYAKAMSGPWRVAFVLSAVAALYLNVFVLVVQLFLKVPMLHALAPQQNEPPFAIAQAVVLLAFVGAAVLAVRRFHPKDDEALDASSA
jgi:hypothetical protein